jgi:hypothetical protein
LIGPPNNGCRITAWYHQQELFSSATPDAVILAQAALTGLAGTMRRKAMTAPAIEAALLTENRERRDSLPLRVLITRKLLISYTADSAHTAPSAT